MSGSTSKREYAIDYVGKGKKTVQTAGGGNVVLNAGVHALDGPEHTHLDSYVKSTQGGEETVDAHGAAGTAVTLDLADGNWHSITLDGDATVTVTGFTADLGCSAIVKVTQDGTGGHAITWDADIVFAVGADDQPAQTASVTSWFVLASDEGDGVIYGFPVGGSGPDLSAIDFLVGTASGLLSGEIVVGATPGGELGGTWGSPTVDATHSGSTHAATQAAAEATAAAALAAHVAAGSGIGGHAHVVSEAHLSNGSATLYTLDQAFEDGSVIAWNTTTLARLGVTETQPDQATVSAAGTTGDTITFDYAATVV